MVSQAGSFERGTEQQAAIRAQTAASLWTLGQAAVVFALSFGLLALILFATPGFLGTDDYYHTRAATEIITQGRLALDFPWLPLTLLSPARYSNHHLLFHMFIAPFAVAGGIAGAKLATALIAAGVFTAVWTLLRQVGASAAWLWALGLFAMSTPFLMRILMVRTQGASLLVLVLALTALFARRYRWLIALGFAYAWLYNGFVLLVGVAGLYVLASWWADGELDLRPILYVTVGIALGLVINPYFPVNVLFAVEHLGAKVSIESSVRVGNEWYPYTTGALMSNSGGALLALAAAMLRPALGSARRDRVSLTLLFVALLTLVMTLNSRRFIEYFPAFALLAAAAAWGRNPLPWPTLGVLPTPRLIRLGASVVAVTVAAVFGASTVGAALDDARNSADVETFAGASAWLRDNTPAGSMVFQTDWDDFTRLFYYNTHNVYLVGLDPTYLERADPALWQEWVAITRGEVEQPASVILKRFGARYVVSDTRHQAFERQAQNDPAMTLVYQDQYSLVWRIRDEGTGQPGTP
ncbi:MAG: hypothetical protein IT323_12005 [Anaerolineae bacterium]|nr:hypothetical protein [Anaerolineae bacterium]